MGTMNRTPAGFLDLVGAITSGQNPSQYSEVISPGIDLTDLLLGFTMDTVQAQVGGSAIGSLIEIVVPDGELWVLRSVGIQTTLTTLAQYEQWLFELRHLPRDDSGVENTPFFSTKLMTVQTVNGRANDAFALPHPWVMVPGMSIVASIKDRDADPARNSTARYGISRLLSA